MPGQLATLFQGECICDNEAPARLAQVDRRIGLAARSMGAGLFTRISGMILPNIRFGLVTAVFLTFVLSREETGVTLATTPIPRSLRSR